MEPENIEVRNARQHNLRNVSVTLPRNRLIVFTGVSGSGKSSLAFDTLYAEGQRRYIESLSAYARQFIGQMQKPDCDLITGLSPSIAIEQKTTGWNQRSTVGTITGILDFLRVLYARVGRQHCPECGRPIAAQSREQVLESILRGHVPSGEPAAGLAARALILAPVARGQKGEFRDLFDDLIRAGYVRARVDGQVVSLREAPALQKNQRHDIDVVIDRLEISENNRGRLAEAVDAALRWGQGTLVVCPADAESTAAPGGRRRGGQSLDRVFSSRYACPVCELSLEPPTPQLFSFNSPTGMCHSCDGLGEQFDFDPDLLVPDASLNFWAPCVAPLRTKIGRWRRHIYEGVARALGIDLDRPWKDLPAPARRALLNGTGDRHITYEWRWSKGVWRHGGKFEGVIEELRQKYRQAKAPFIRQYYEKFMTRRPCSACEGGRLNPQALAVRLPVQGAGRGPSIREFAALSVEAAWKLLERLDLTPVQRIIAEDLLKEVRARLQFLLNVGLYYLTLERTAPTLSGGELQRIRLAGQIGAGLAGVLYVLDEPSIGLHPRDNQRLLESLCRLRDLGNTVIVVEHDEATMRAADHIVDFGPGPGVRGGRIVAEGAYADILRSVESLTGRYLSGREEIPIPVRRPVVVTRKRRGEAKNGKRPK